MQAGFIRDPPDLVLGKETPAPPARHPTWARLAPRIPETTMAKKGWAPFPHPNKAFDYAGDKLAKAWKTLHAGDQEPYPDDQHVGALLKAHPKLGKDAAATAAALQEAWRAFHRGDFQEAYEAGLALKALGASVAIKAGGIHATYLLDSDKDKLARYESLAKLAEEAIATLPGEANSHYRHAFALGRYSQCLSIAQALAKGIAGKVKTSLDATLELAPKHAEAHTALGLYHAEIVGKVGGMLAKLTYGASAAAAERHLKEALKLTPDSPIAHVEYANALMLLHGDKKEDEAAMAFAKAAKCKPHDAMEALDAAFAREQIE
jgi:tetratricopeptide (TPR) repeat protein